ncbi:MAG: BMP family ABC transporter substrate-binding protein, partial [Actinomycetota bacterium]|nr:BMP family ABC transporter substrate-binding protein [Actinomycetota bacterium]
TTEGATTTTADETTTTEGGTTTTAAAVEPITACQVTDTGGIDDKSFNQTAWKGVTDAQAAGYATEDSDFVESQTATDYQPNIQAFIDKGCDLIITVGFLLGADTETMATANPDQNFQIIDFAYGEGVVPNVQGAVFGTTDAAFLAGYLAAGMSETGVVATYGGIQIPCGVTCFMDGFVYGVRYYNQEKGTDVQVLGWNPEEQTGVFTGDFENELNGRNVTQSFVDESADVILPVAGPVGKGSAALAQEEGDVWVIGVDADWFVTLPEFTDVILTSVLKGLDVAVSTAVKDVAEGNFQGETRLYAIADDGVGLGPIADGVPADLAGEVEAIKEALKDGSLIACDMADGASDSCAG